jgi:hypothetical protein
MNAVLRDRMTGIARGILGTEIALLGLLLAMFLLRVITA